MFEGGGSGQTGGGLELADQLPGIEGVEEIDVARTTVNHFDGQLSLGHEDTRGFLIRIASVLQL